MRWCDDGLRAVVRFARNRNDGLPGELRIGLRRLRSLRAARVEWRKVFRGLVVDHLRVVEGRLRHHLRLQREESSECNQERERRRVVGTRLQEASPRKPALDHYVGPEKCRSRTEFERRQTGGENEVAQILVEDARPGRQFDEKPRNGHWLPDFAEENCGHRIYSRCGKSGWDTQEVIGPKGKCTRTVRLWPKCSQPRAFIILCFGNSAAFSR